MSFWLDRGVDGFYMRHTDRILQAVLVPYSSGDNNDGSVSSSGDMLVKFILAFFHRLNLSFNLFKDYRPGLGPWFFNNPPCVSE